MRRSRETIFQADEYGIFFGITLAGDFTAEHEWGVKDIQRSFKIPAKDTSIVGIKRYTITDLHLNLSFLKKGKKKVTEALLYFNENWGLGEELDNKAYPNKDFFNRRELNNWEPTPCSAWDGASFGVRVFDKESIDKLEEVYEAFLRGDIAIWVGGQGIFNRGGLHIIIPSKMPKEYIQQLYLDHLESNRLKDAVSKLTIEEDLKAAGKRWHALSPAFFKDENGNEIIKFWLNPWGQKENNFGWFTEKELRQWINNEGPIPVKNEKANTIYDYIGLQ